MARQQEKKKENDQSPNKRQHLKVQNAQWGASPKRRNKVTWDLNHSPLAQSESCKEMDERPKRTPSLEKASLHPPV